MIWPSEGEDNHRVVGMDPMQNKLIWLRHWSATSLLAFLMKTVPQLAAAQTKPFTRHPTQQPHILDVILYGVDILKEI
jgi:hypothetical protein